MSTELGNNSERTTFCLVHGRHHDGWCWESVRKELDEQGWPSIAPDLPIEDPLLSLEDHAEVMADAEAASGAETIVRVGWSWGANIIPRAIGGVSIKKLIFVAGAFHRSTIEQWGDESVRATHSIAYDAMQTSLPLDPPRALAEVADYVFYHDIEDDILKAKALAHLRDHPRREDEPGLPVFPELPREYILTTQDRAVAPASQKKIAELLDVEPIPIESGHAPMLSRPQELAHWLIHLATQEVV